VTTTAAACMGRIYIVLSVRTKSACRSRVNLPLPFDL
jgi:hypothetical protein